MSKRVLMSTQTGARGAVRCHQLRLQLGQFGVEPPRSSRPSLRIQVADERALCTVWMVCQLRAQLGVSRMLPQLSSTPLLFYEGLGP